MKKTFISLAITAALMAASPAAFAGSSNPPLVDGALMATDIFIVRPVAVAYTAGAIVAWPFAALVQKLQGNDVAVVTEALINEPVWFTVTRPLGKFSR